MKFYIVIQKTNWLERSLYSNEYVSIKMQINAVCVERQWMIFWISTKMFSFCLVFHALLLMMMMMLLLRNTQFPQQYLLYARLFQIEKLINIYETFKLILNSLLEEKKKIRKNKSLNEFSELVIKCVSTKSIEC